MVGKIVYSSGGNFKVFFDGNVYNAKVRGALKTKDKLKLVIGDLVNFVFIDNNFVLVTKILERKNNFTRPSVSNIDNVLIIHSVKSPKSSEILLSKLITFLNFNNIQSTIVFTKRDLDLETSFLLEEKYKLLGVDNFSIGDKIIKESEEKRIFKILAGKFSLVIGESGVGKSTLVRNISREENIKVGEISKFIERGKQTTKHYEAFLLGNDSFLIDSPGFSFFDLSGLREIDIAQNFFNFFDLSKECKFSNCTHIFEDKCNIKKIINLNPKLSNVYKIYKNILSEQIREL